MGDTAFMQLKIGVLHRRGDPRAVGVVARGGARLDDIRKGPVEGYLVARLPQHFAQAARNMQFVRE
ncbi:hypothetical protein D9M68_773730 [compost metagenome]